jgi:hypothetical protein
VARRALIVVACVAVVVMVAVVAFRLVDARGEVEVAAGWQQQQAVDWLPKGVDRDVVRQLAREYAPVYAVHPDEQYPSLIVEGVRRGRPPAGGEPVAYWMTGGPYTTDPRADYAFTIQYWSYYDYNAYDQPLFDSNHEGDWERVAIEFESDRVRSLGADALPARVFYGHHAADEEMGFVWGDQMAFKRVDDTHPITWIAHGSHGNWPKCGAGGGGDAGAGPTANGGDDAGEGGVANAAAGEADSANRIKRDARVLWMATYDKLPPCDTPPQTPKLLPLPVDDWACYPGRWGSDRGRITGTSPLGPRFQQPPFASRSTCHTR